MLLLKTIFGDLALHQVKIKWKKENKWEKNIKRVKLLVLELKSVGLLVLVWEKDLLAS